MRKILTILFSALLSAAAASAAVDVRDFGARGDGRTIDTDAINAAIEAASAMGGGTVNVPAGTYMVYSIHLRSHINLHLEPGAVIKGAPVTETMRYDFPEPGPEPQFQDFGHSHWQNSLIWGIGLEDVTISGKGMVDGSNLGHGYRTEDLQDGLANKAIALKDCRNVTLQDFTIYHGGHFAVLATGVDNLYITGMTVDTNRDGYDIDCCRNVRVTDCCVNAPQDDAIVLKASYALGRFQDTRDVVISGCNISGYDVGSLLSATYVIPESIYIKVRGSKDKTQHCGRIKLGTETSGGFKNISVSNCTFNRCGGLFIESEDGGDVEDIVISNIVMHDCTDTPLFVRLGERMRSPEGTPVGHIRRVSVSDMICTGGNPAFNCIIAGTPGHRIEDFSLRNIRIISKGGCSPEAALAWNLPEAEAKYPDPWLFGDNRDHILPFSALMLRHVDGVEMENVTFDFEQPDSRRLFWTDDALNVRYRNIRSAGKTVKVK